MRFLLIIFLLSGRKTAKHSTTMCQHRLMGFLLMATDYDAPRKQDEELKTDSLDELKARRSDSNSGSVDEDETIAAEEFELPGADLSNVELSVDVIPAQDDEFTCSQCFLVHHRSQLAYEENSLPVCVDCAA